jgi:hypothetical protein
MKLSFRKVDPGWTPATVVTAPNAAPKPWYGAQFASGPLFFCGHHWRKLADAATPVALFVVDERTDPAESSMLPVA